MSGAAQLTLDLGQRPALGREDFLVAPGNEVAVAWIDRWPDWPGPVLALHGPAGCGKSHLAEVWRASSGALRLEGEGLAAGEARDLLGAATACVLDHVEARVCADAACAARLLALYNIVVERGGARGLPGAGHPDQQRRRSAARGFPRVVARRLGQGAGCEHDHPDRADQGDRR